MRIQINIKMAKDKFADTFCFMLCYREFLIFFTASSTSQHTPRGHTAVRPWASYGEQFNGAVQTWNGYANSWRELANVWNKLKSWGRGCICYIFIFMYSRVISTWRNIAKVSSTLSNYSMNSSRLHIWVKLLHNISITYHIYLWGYMR